MPAADEIKNRDVSWDEFSPEQYFENNYASENPSDTLIIEKLIEFYKSGDRDIDVLDVGTGSNLYPIVISLCWARSITAWEYGRRNCQWLSREIERDAFRPQLVSIWERVAQECEHCAQIDPAERMPKITKIVQGSIFDLPVRRFDVASMFFVAESITQDWGEFERACSRWIDAVRPEGRVFGAFMENSKGYNVDGRHFPAVRLTKRKLEFHLRRRLRDLVVERVGIVGGRLRPGYSGMLLAHGVVAAD